MEDNKIPLLPQENKPLEGYSNTRIFLIVFVNLIYISIFCMFVYLTRISDNPVWFIMVYVMPIFYVIINIFMFTFEYNIKQLKEKRDYYKQWKTCSLLVMLLDHRIWLLYKISRDSRRRNNSKIRNRRRHPEQGYSSDLESIDPDDARELSVHSSDEEESAVLSTA